MHHPFFQQLTFDNFDKSNEITAIPSLLESLFLKGTAVTIDAMGCQKDIVEKIVGKQAGYVISLKENQPHLFGDVTLSFQKKKCDDFHESIDYGHGRIEERKCGIIRDLNSILNKDCWKNLHSIVRLESKRIFKKTGRTQQETRYYIS